MVPQPWVIGPLLALLALGSSYDQFVVLGATRRSSFRRRQSVAPGHRPLGGAGRSTSCCAPCLLWHHSVRALLHPIGVRKPQSRRAVEVFGIHRIFFLFFLVGQTFLWSNLEFFAYFSLGGINYFLFSGLSQRHVFKSPHSRVARVPGELTPARRGHHRPLRGWWTATPPRSRSAVVGGPRAKTPTRRSRAPRESPGP